MKHELKTDPEVFAATRCGKKRFEIRLNDRNYQEGDTLVLKETRYTGAEMKAGAPLRYTGEEIEMEVCYILHGPIYGLAEGWVVMGTQPSI